MKYILLIALLGMGMCLSMDQSNEATQAQIQEIEASKIGLAILKMAELNYKLQGPVDELIETIKSFGRQLIERIEQENMDFEAIKAENSVKVKELQSIVNEAEIEQNKQRKRIATEFEPRKADIESQLLRLKDENTQNSSQVKMQDALRKQQNQNFKNTLKEQGNLVEVVDEALRFIGTLLPRPDASLIEMDKVQMQKDEQKELGKRLKSIKTRLENQNNKIFGSFLQTLVEMTEQQSFKQRHFIKSVIDLLNQLRKSLVENQQKIIEDEKQSLRAYEQWYSAQGDETGVFNQMYQDLLEEREDTQSFIADCENIIKIHESDIQLYTERVRLEEGNFLLSKQTHEELAKQINNELDVIQKSIKLMYSPAIFEYLKYKMNLGA